MPWQASQIPKTHLESDSTAKSIKSLRAFTEFSKVLANVDTFANCNLTNYDNLYIMTMEMDQSTPTFQVI